jgi:hypothetical protein
MNTQPTELELYIRALAAARAELATIRTEYERLGKRKSQLEAFIANGEPLIPEGPQLPQLTFPEPTIEGKAMPPLRGPMPRWKEIVLSINGKGDNFSVSDALHALERMGRPVKANNPFQIVRAELLRKTDKFRKLGPGRYALVKGDEKELAS